MRYGVRVIGFGCELTPLSRGFHLAAVGGFFYAANGPEQSRHSPGLLKGG